MLFAILAVIFVLPPLMAWCVRRQLGVETSRKLWSTFLTWYFLLAFVVSALMMIAASVLFPGFFVLGVPFVFGVLLTSKLTARLSGVTTHLPLVSIRRVFQTIFILFLSTFLALLIGTLLNIRSVHSAARSNYWVGAIFIVALIAFGWLAFRYNRPNGLEFLFGSAIYSGILSSYMMLLLSFSFRPGQLDAAFFLPILQCASVGLGYGLASVRARRSR